MRQYNRINILGLIRMSMIIGFILLSFQVKPIQGVTVSLVTEGPWGPAAKNGLSQVQAALQDKEFDYEMVTSLSSARGETIIISGIPQTSAVVAKMISAAGVSAPKVPESLLVRHTLWQGKKTLLISGADDRGLMYALLDVADRIGWSENPAQPLQYVQNIYEQPYVAERALSIYTMHQSTFESFFFDDKYWERFLGMLAKNRFNTFALLFGYENWGYFSPPYPYFFDVKGFSDVKVVGITEEQQRRNFNALKKVIQMTHDRGLNFTLGIWDHIYRGGVQGPRDRAGKPTAGIVWGVTAENLTDYTKAALTKLVREFPEIDAIQFRMHGESGLKRGAEMQSFWGTVYQVMKEHAPQMRFDARAKNYPDALIKQAVDMGLNFRICTKYWMEQMGLPFHPTHVHPRNQHDRRHGYADLLRYPQKYKIHWRLWNSGTNRILLWGSPDYVRRFAESTHLYNGEGFEVSFPPTTKMQDQPHDDPPFDLLNPKYRYYDWEFERYWHFFQTFGRMGYNPNTLPEVWEKEFEKRFGKEAAPYVEQAIHKASEILPRIVAYNYPYSLFPTTRGWVEKQRMKDLPEYAMALPSDTQQFLSMADAADCILTGKDSAKIWPQQSSRWFSSISDEILIQVEKAEQHIGEALGKEFVSTMVDMRILAYLAQYHSHRAQAGLSYALFVKSKDLNALDEAIRQEGRAIQAWEKLVAAAGDVYHFNMRMGRRHVGLWGHWRDELTALKEGMKKLIDQRQNYRPPRTEKKPFLAHVPIRKISPSRRLILRATINGTSKITNVKVNYGKDNKYSVRMKKGEPNLYHVVIPAGHIEDGTNYFIEATDKAGNKSQSERITVTVSDDLEPPIVKHKPIAKAPAETPLQISANVSDPAGVKWIRLRYRSVTQYQDYKTLEMIRTDKPDQYQAVVPAEAINPKWDFMYLIEVMDTKGNGKIYPDLEKEMPYIIVKLER